MGMVDSGMVQLKPERRDLYSEKPELEPVWLYCDMESEGGIGVTVVGKKHWLSTEILILVINTAYNLVPTFKHRIWLFLHIKTTQNCTHAQLLKNIKYDLSWNFNINFLL